MGKHVRIIVLDARTRGKPNTSIRDRIHNEQAHRRASSRVASRTGDLISPVYLYLPRSFRGARPRQERRASNPRQELRLSGGGHPRLSPGSTLRHQISTLYPDTPTLRHQCQSTHSVRHSDTRESVGPVSSHQCQAVSMVSKQNRHSDTRHPRHPPDTPRHSTPPTLRHYRPRC